MSSSGSTVAGTCIVATVCHLAGAYIRRKFDLVAIEAHYFMVPGRRSNRVRLRTVDGRATVRYWCNPKLGRMLILWRLRLEINVTRLQTKLLLLQSRCVRVHMLS